VGEPEARWAFTTELWRSDSVDSWVFVTVPAPVSEEIRMAAGPPTGFGSVRVEVALGSTTWRTSVFPDAASGCFVLPVKRAVRVAEGVDDGDAADFELEVVS
jgi:hypothetical protein